MNRTNAIIVLYNPSDEQIARLKNQSANFDKCYVVDNSSSISGNLVDFPGCIYIPLMNNLGIAEAQNIALQQILYDTNSALTDLVFFFDQDSIYDEALIFSLKMHFLRLFSDDQRNRVVGPYYVVEDDLSEPTSLITEYNQKKSIISSGTVTNILTLEECGLLKSELFIDCVDHEWCWRVSKSGYRINQVNSIKMAHKIGDGTLFFLGFGFNVCNKYRCYYQFRNWTYLLTRGSVPKEIVLKSIILLLLRFLAYTCKSGGFSKSFYCLLGSKDGLLGRLGKRDFK